MQVNAIPYRVTPDGHVDHWLVAGPDDQDWVPEGGTLGNSLASTLPEPTYLETFTRPVEWEPPLQAGSEAHRWMYRRSLADHRLDLADTHAEPVLRRYWLYAEVLPGHRSNLALAVEAVGKVSLWAMAARSRVSTWKGAARRSGFDLLCPAMRVCFGCSWNFGPLSAVPGRVSCPLVWNLMRAAPGSTCRPTVSPDRRLGLEAVIGDFARIAMSTPGLIRSRCAGPRTTTGRPFWASTCVGRAEPPTWR